MTSKINEVRFTICPVGNASYIAAKKGWLDEALAPLGVRPVRLQTLSSEHWKAHFDYSDDALFREGGNIPPLWAKSTGAGVVLIGAAALATKQYIVVKNDSPLVRVEQLAGRRVGIPVRSKALIDFRMADALQGFRIALASRGFLLSSANIVKIVTEDSFHSTPLDEGRKGLPKEFDALENGEIDAVCVKQARVGLALTTGKFRILYDLAENKKQLSPINNIYPEILTVSQRLAEERPDIVAAYVKQVVRAGRWAKTHYGEALKFLAEQIFATETQAAISFDPDFNWHLELNLSEENLNLLEGQKRFLYDNGFIDNDFELSDWTDSRFLKIAVKELSEESLKGVLNHAG
jgi:2'-hydroxybiphenyl-2-sulfinate desulfinase